MSYLRRFVRYLPINLAEACVNPPEIDNAFSRALYYFLTRSHTLNARDRANQAYPITVRRPASEQLRGISLVTREPIEFPPRRLLGECLFFAP